MTNNMKYFTLKLNDDIYAINDDAMCTTYVIIGKNKALVIDTGINSNEESLLFNIKKITSLPLIVVLTHGHYDHTGHLYEFDSFYVNEDDKDLFYRNPEYLNKAIYLKNYQEFDLGGTIIKAFFNKGHTLGSTLFIDEYHKVIFTGDQFGSGCGVWMQVLSATTLSTYIASIDSFIAYLNTYPYDINEWTLYGGHLGQEETGKLGHNPLNIKMVLNMKELSKLLIENKVKLEDTKATAFNNEKSYYARYENAEMIIRKSLIK